MPSVTVTFPISGVTTAPFVPFLVMLGISLVTGTAGVSGAFVLLPFQVSVLGYTGPGVTATNHLFNVIAIPAGLYRFVREGRMLWPLAAVLVAGYLPGVVAGAVVRIALLPDPRTFRLFVGCVLLVIGGRMVARLVGGGGKKPTPGGGRVEVASTNWRTIRYTFAGETYRVPVVPLSLLSVVVGVVGGAYGVGGGALIAPVLVSVLRLPIHTVAGANLAGTFSASVFGVIAFYLVDPLFGIAGARPDWMLAGLFGLGGLCGLYLGARLQKRLPARAIEVVLALAVSAVALRYVVGYFQ